MWRAQGYAKCIHYFIELICKLGSVHHFLRNERTEI